MVFLFGPSLAERSQVVRALHALGPTSIEGLAAALSWSPRKTERLVATLARRGEGGIWYTPRLREVRIGRPPEAPSSTVPFRAPETGNPDGFPNPSPSPRVEARPGGPSTPSHPPALPTLRGGPQKCPKCHATMELLGDHVSLVCPRCGRLSLAPRSPVPSGPVSAVGDPPAGIPPGRDRRSQEMLAAYVTARPIPCPRCRAPLRHSGVGTFRCSSCGEGVSFPPESPTLALPPLPTLAPAPPR
ncbi:MAG TPA: hypothetical protein VGS23_01450 [Thermoplasmata archaeon]|nr:hypothetical protein [Thermoplasmata archaeon]